MIAEIGDWVIGEVAAIARRLARNGFNGRLAFNISPRQVDRPDFFPQLRQAFADAEVPLSMVELEFTESAAMEVSDGVLDEIAALRADGARIAIDDFGTGYSNLARLRSMPLDRVKLDPSLIADIDTQREGAGDRPGGDPADQGRRLRGRRRSGRDRRPGRHPARHGLRHRPGLRLRAGRCSKQEFLAWIGKRPRRAKSVA